MAYTVKNLRDDVNTYNRYLVESGSAYYYRESGRNGYQAIDQYTVDLDGDARCNSFVAGGSSRECLRAIQCGHHGLKGYTHPYKKLTRAQAFKFLKIAGIDFSADFFSLGSWDVGLLVTWAKITKYYKPRHANGSRARYFYAHLQRKFNK